MNRTTKKGIRETLAFNVRNGYRVSCKTLWDRVRLEKFLELFD
jgi:hypothetical protein